VLLCSCTALRNHLQVKVNDNIPNSASLFAYQTPGGGWEHMSKHRFMSFCVDIWKKACLAHVLDHSFQIGGAVEILRAGVPPQVVAATGGWTSLAFLLYWRHCCTPRKHDPTSSMQSGGNPGIPHLEAAKRILRYLRGTSHFLLALGRQDHDSVDLVGWTDSNWAKDPDS
jgi:hypothetical protein